MLDRKFLKPEELGDAIAVVVGTRPGIIKLAPIIRALQKIGQDYFIAHTGQHYSYNMDEKFFNELELPEPRFKNDVVKRAKLHGAQTAKMIEGLEKAFITAKPKLVIVGGDANTNLAGALAARKLGIKIAHVEAGLRSGDWRMPEEHNRIIIDHISDFLFAPNEEAKQNLIKDNVKGEIIVAGSTIVDAIYENLALAKQKSHILKQLKLSSNNYSTATIHREENVDSENTLQDILKGLARVAEESDKEIIFPIHPRTKKRLEQFGLKEEADDVKGLRIINALGYLDFLALLSEARLVLTDSGGIQQESCILHVPCVTLRENTEWVETVVVGANVIAGSNPDGILGKSLEMLNRERNWHNPFGDSGAAMRIVQRLID